MNLKKIMLRPMLSYYNFKNFSFHKKCHLNAALGFRELIIYVSYNQIYFIQIKKYENAKLLLSYLGNIWVIFRYQLYSPKLFYVDTVITGCTS